jgi:hypothetical protein
MSVGFSWFIWAPTVRPDDRQILATSLAAPEIDAPPSRKPPYNRDKALALAARAVVGVRPDRGIQRQRACSPSLITLPVAKIVRPEPAQLLERLAAQWASYVAFLASFCYAGMNLSIRPCRGRR